MSTVRSALPKVLVPYPGPTRQAGVQDIFVYLRPETNDVRVESAVLKVIEKSSAYKTDITLVYLANVPGEFIVEHRIVEHHYGLKLDFATRGRDAFTPSMREGFQRFFGIPFEKAPIVGSFEALRRLDLRPEELFNRWVSESDIYTVNGQTIKRVDGLFVVNYDIPALLHKNSVGTDIAVMIFRSAVGYGYFNNLVEQMRQALVANKLLNPNVHPSRAFHYSKGPFEQILDGSGYLYTPGEIGAIHSIAPGLGTASLADLTFSVYLAEHGVDHETIRGVLDHPILQFLQPDGSIIEDNLFGYTMFDPYPVALQKLNTMVAQVRLPI